MGTGIGVIKIGRIKVAAVMTGLVLEMQHAAAVIRMDTAVLVEQEDIIDALVAGEAYTLVECS